MRSIEQGQVEDRARRKLALPRLEIDDDVAERIERLGAEERALELLDRLPPDQATRSARGCSSNGPTRRSPLRFGSRRRSCASASAAAC